MWATRPIRLKLDKDEFRVSSSSTEAGASQDSIEIAYKADPLVIGLNSQYLLDFLRAANTREILLEFKDPQSAGQLRPEEDTGGEQYKYRLHRDADEKSWLGRLSPACESHAVRRDRDADAGFLKLVLTAKAYFRDQGAFG